MSGQGYEGLLQSARMPCAPSEIYSRSAGKVLLQAANYLVEGLQSDDATGLAKGELKNEETILDIGCGTGESTQMLLRTIPSVRRVVAFDIEQRFIEQAQTLVTDKRVTFLQMDAEADWPEYWGNKFTKIFSNYTFHWLKDHRKLLKQIRKVLKPGGQLICQFFHSGSGQGEMAAVRKAAIETGVGEIIQQHIQQRVEPPWKNIDNYTTLVKMSGLTLTTCQVCERILKLDSKQQRAEMALNTTPIVAAIPPGKRGQFAARYAENLADPLTIKHNVVFLRMYK